MVSCANKCGLKVNYLCWLGCAGSSSAAVQISALANCAASNCISNVEEITFEQIGKAIDEYLRSEWTQ